MPTHQVVEGSVKSSAVKKGSRVDLQSLLLVTAYHPKGRVEIDPVTGLIRNPKNNVMFKKKLAIKVDGHVVDTKEVSVNGGHVLAEGSVWRLALAGPAKYHWKVTQDDHRYTYQGKTDRTAPELTGKEMEEYQFFRAFLLKHPNLSVQEGTFKEVNKAFYEWLQKQDLSKIELPPLVVFRQVSAPATPSSVR